VSSNRLFIEIDNLDHRRSFQMNLGPSSNNHLSEITNRCQRTTAHTLVVRFPTRSDALHSTRRENEPALHRAGCTRAGAVDQSARAADVVIADRV
jgi:hypothetical protein